MDNAEMMKDEVPDRKCLSEARERFAALLTETDTSEARCQELFAECPYILSMGLPITLLPQDIRPLGRPGRTEPDFIFFPNHKPRIHQSYGVIELKTPQSQIVSSPRRNTLILTRCAETARSQARTYLSQFRTDGSEGHQEYIVSNEDALFLGNNLHVFIIMGLTNELREKLVSAVLRRQWQDLLQGGFNLLTYDCLYNLFSARVPPRTMCAVPAGPQPSASDASSYTMKCPKCNYTMHERIVDNWYIEEMGASDSDGNGPRYESHYTCFKCGYQY
jgi:hypothetical protein